VPSYLPAFVGHPDKNHESPHSRWSLSWLKRRCLSGFVLRLCPFLVG
jgi:hypothetical protein